jgi:threonine dehydratase
LGADAIPSAGLIAASGGNHGLAVAHVARELGLPAEIYVPEVSPRIKVESIARLGAEVTVVGALYHDALAAAELREAETGALAIHAYDHVLTVAGQGTMAREIAAQVSDVAEVLIAVGGGGLVSGAAAWFEDSTPVVAVEPQGSSALHSALDAGRPVDVDIDSIASDSLGARSIGPIPWSVLAQHTPRSVLVRDESIRAAQEWFWRELKLVVEPGGATAFAAVLDGTHRPDPDGGTVVVVCGANTDPGQFTVSD